LLVVVSCAGVCVGVDHHARSLATASGPAAPVSSPGHPREDPKPPEATPASPSGVEAEESEARPTGSDPWAGPRAALQLYGNCRVNGAWAVRASADEARRRLAHDDLTEDERRRMERTQAAIDGFLDPHTATGKVMAVCGMLGPSTNPYAESFPPTP
jgi:hypothetical protein